MERQAVTDRFDGKVAIVTGGSFGIGRAIAEELCREGAAVVFSGIEPEGAETETKMKAAGYNVRFCLGDHMQENFCRTVIDTAVETFGTVNYLVNNAFSFNAAGLDATVEDWERSLFVGPVAYARMAQFAATPMKTAGGGAILNISSISANIAQPNRWTYNASKGAVSQLTRCQALDLSPFNIRVNSISPGWTWTREVIKAAETAGGGIEKWDPVWGKFAMLRRCADPIEMTGPALFLLSDDASFITGTDLPVDGGYSAMGPEGLGESSSFAGSD
jgi:NAD(P)-dependent dehydrogenase (short-subunit alcohol dehydrogenase family)